MTAILETHELTYAVEGELKPLVIDVPADATAAHVLALITARHRRADLVEILFEDDDQPVSADYPIVADLRKGFRLIHVATRGRVNVVLHHNGRKADHKFRPSATIRRVIEWAISEKGFGLLGEPAEFQIKLDGRPLPADVHVGQIARGAKVIDAKLVHNVKPQG